VAHAAIDAGASIVIGHHPHVLQGFEWYKGKLIAYSLGNLIFDQDFLSTFASTLLRTVWDGDKLLEACLIQHTIVDYRPYAVTDAAARRTLLTIWERSVLGAMTDRSSDGAVRAFSASLPANVQAAHLAIESDGARILTAPPKKGGVTLP